jgi:hypothetical protein
MYRENGFSVTVTSDAATDCEHGIARKMAKTDFAG